MPTPRRRPMLVALGALCLSLCSLPDSGAAQPYSRWAVPDSLLPGALRAGAGGFEGAWNALLVAGLRAEQQRADSAAALMALARRVARAEPEALGTSIGGDALRLRSRWTPPQRHLRVRAAVVESAGVAAQAARNFPRADSLLASALDLYRRLDERRRVAWVLGTLGQAAFQARRLERSDSLYREALAARRGIGDQKMVGNTLNALGSTNYLRNRFAEAYAYFQQARSVRERTGERAALANTLNFLALSARDLGRADSARVWFQSALDTAVALGDSALTSSVLINYGILIRDRQDPERAERMFRRALGIARQRGDVERQMTSSDHLAEVLRGRGRFGEAAELLEGAAALGEESRSPLLCLVLNSLGRAWLGLYDPERARPPLERALAVADSLGDAGGVAGSLNNLALAAALARDPAGAERLARRALGAAVQAGDSAVAHDASLTLGHLAVERRADGEAELWFRRALGAGAALDRSAMQAEDHAHLGAAMAREGKLEQAEAEFRLGLELAGRAEAADYAWISLVGLGDVAERRGDFPAALARLREAASALDTLRGRQDAEERSVTLFAGSLFAYEALIHLLGKLAPSFPDSGYDAEAFAWAERARARALLDLMARGGATAAPPRPLTLEEARVQVRARDEALLEYSVGDSSTSLWVLRDKGWRRFSVPARPALRLRVEQLRRAMARADASESRAARAAARALYLQVLAPAESFLRGVKRLRIGADDLLALVPFEALLAEEPKGEGPPRRGAYLVDRYAISYLPSASALAPARAARGNRGIFALGNPCFTCGLPADSAGAASPALEPLPNTAAEVEALRSAAGDRRFTALVAAGASRSGVLGSAELGAASLVHLATHGVANEAEPGRSGLWLAPERGGDGPGFLALSDISGIGFRAELVTLSACETGLGRLERGEGLLGLTRAFLAAGAGSVLVSLWAVNDRSSALLMERFYSELLGKGAASDLALADAKRALRRRRETAAPFYWAPFVLVGRAGALE